MTSSAPSLFSSEYYGKEMGEGWKKGLVYKYNNQISMFLDTNVVNKNDHNNLAGDIDAAIHCSRDLCIRKDLFPAGYTNIRPYNFTTSSTSFLAEIKRTTSNERAAEKNVKQFVNFYYNLLKNKSTLRIDLLPPVVQQIIKNVDTKLLFVFNGSDFIKIEDKMKEEIFNVTNQRQMKICGRQVICVWCNATELIKWKDMLEKAKTEKAFEKAKKENEKAIEKMKEEIARLRNQLNKEHPHKKAKLG